MNHSGLCCCYLCLAISLVEEIEILQFQTLVYDICEDSLFYPCDS